MVDVVTQTEYFKFYKSLSARIDLLTDRVNCNEFVVASLGKELEEITASNMSGNKVGNEFSAGAFIKRAGSRLSGKSGNEQNTQNGKEIK